MSVILARIGLKRSEQGFNNCGHSLDVEGLDTAQNASRIGYHYDIEGYRSLLSDDVYERITGKRRSK